MKKRLDKYRVFGYNFNHERNQRKYHFDCIIKRGLYMKGQHAVAVSSCLSVSGLASSRAVELDQIPELFDEPDGGPAGLKPDNGLPTSHEVPLGEVMFRLPDQDCGDVDDVDQISAEDLAEIFQELETPPWVRYRWDAAGRVWVDEAGQPVSPAVFGSNWSVLQMLGVYGCRGIDDAILAGLALREPVLLIGAPGCAKTAMAERIATDLDKRFWAYDASKAMFEDIIGFPDPSSLSRGEVVYVPTPLSLVGKQFILVDEVSRAHPGLQNKWLEIIRARRVMGMGLPELEFVFGAMNPPGLAGTVPLDEALAGRFVFHISVPEIRRMDAADRRTVIEAADGADGLPPCEGSRLAFFVDAVIRRMPAVRGERGPEITNYLMAFSEYLSAKDLHLDARRLGMMRRGLIGLIAAREVLWGCPVTDGRIADCFREGLDVLLPFSATGREVPRVLIDGAHRHAVAAMKGRRRALAPTDVFAVATAAVRGECIEDQDAFSMAVTRILQAIDHPRDLNVTIRAGAALFVLASSPQALSRIPLESCQRVMVAWADLIEMDGDAVEEFLDEAASAEMPLTIPEAHMESFLRIVGGIEHAIAASRLPGVEFKEILAKMSEIIGEGGVTW